MAVGGTFALVNLINSRALGTKSQSEGRKRKMEGKTRKARKLALFTAGCAAALLLSIGQPQQASAQIQVTANGVGDLLIFQYWTTQGRDTLFAIVNAFGGDAAGRFVHIRIREGVSSVEVRNFTICLSPGDVWTAALTASGTTSTLRVGNPGSCDATVAAAGFTAPPVVGLAVPVGATFGYIEAYTMEGTAPGVPPGNGDDTLWGVATPVNVTGGFSSSYNATALINFNAFNEAAAVAGNVAVAQALAREGGVDKELLFTRYVAGAGIGAVTQVILTFPTGFRPPAADPISAFFFDENENLNFSPRNIAVPQEVNVCTIAPNAVTTLTRIVCNAEPNGFDVVGPSAARPTCPAGTFCEGWLRLINNAVGPEIDRIDAPPVSRFPVIGLTLSTFVNGALLYDQSFPIQWAAVVGAGATDCPPGSSFVCGSSFAPWFSGGLLVIPGDNTTFALNRTGTNAR